MRITFPFWGTGAKLEKLKKQVGELERKIRQLQEQYAGVADIQQKLEKLNNFPAIEYVYVERITVDRLELNNNFGALGIRELGGTFNVGVNCAGSRPPGAGKIPPPQSPPAGGKTAGPNRRQKGPEKEVKAENGVKKETESSFANQERVAQRCSRNGPDVPENPAGERKSGPVWNIRYGF